MGLFKTLGTRPWLESETTDGGYDGDGASAAPTARIGLIGFMGVASAMFSLFAIAYRMRMTMGSDWLALQEPPILWLNTGLLVLASGAMHWAWMDARKEQFEAARRTMVIAGIITGGFLIGQTMAWNQMVAGGYFAQSNPSYAFFYLLTALHGIHILGGLVAWMRSTERLFLPQETPEKKKRTRVGVELCAIYWHFLFVVWVLLFALMLST